MMKKQIDKPRDVSDDAIFSIIELQLSKNYKTTRVSNSRLNIRKLYNYTSANHREVTHKQLNFKDSGCFTVSDTSIVFMMNLKKQFLFWMILWTFGILITWKIWNASLLLSLFLITTPILIIWLIRTVALKKFMSNELVEISKQLGKSLGVTPSNNHS
ncbi:hypothetical protein [Polaribacter butkevichii]|uniref:Uncharacterized protein n=1 Tax=Polaribacter butkevichii TaxID=218490 RepID=A0A2P6C6P2_9FLAO|nr:hypothetical protein [Polaribacter butkevichii]PQJ68589.1 hypothetical protein BTO14_11005 [Polaribacter butkevichii]